MPSPVNNIELGKRIKQIRLSQGYTLKDIESRVGVSATHVSEVERGKTSPTVGALGKIAQALDVNPSFLVDLPVGEEISLTRQDARVVLTGPNEAARWAKVSRGFTLRNRAAALSKRSPSSGARAASRAGSLITASASAVISCVVALKRRQRMGIGRSVSRIASGGRSEA